MKPAIASRKPYYIELSAGRTIAWCRCGRSARQPFCDGKSHTGTGLTPLVYKAGLKSEELLLCGCKHTGTPPFCDGTHNNLPGGYRGDARPQEELENITHAESDSLGIRRLDGGCYVISPSTGRPAGSTWWMKELIALSSGAAHQAQFYFELCAGISPIISGNGADLVIWIHVGDGNIEVSGRNFSVGPETSIFVKADEAFRFVAFENRKLIAFVSSVPAVNGLSELAHMPNNFDESCPERTRTVDRAQRTSMGSRFFQILIEPPIGPPNTAQFIGHVPQSRGEMHKHLYEEALVVLSGEGLLWNETSVAEVNSTDVIFLPRKHAHALECTSADGMEVVGVICPGTNPAVNY